LKHLPPFPRRVNRDLARVGTVAAAAAVMWGLAGPLVSGRSVVLAAPIDAGPLVVVTNPSNGDPVPLASGTSDTVFKLSYPVGSKCPGDAANNGFRLQSYIAPVSVDLNTLGFDTNGPTAAGSFPLYDIATSPLVASTNLGLGDGVITTTPAFNFAVFAAAPGTLAAGTYNVGLACSKSGAMEKFWSVKLTLAADLSWTLADGTPGPTTTTTTAAPNSSPTTTTTTVPKSATTTTTVPKSATTTTTTTTTTTVAASGATSSTAVSSSGTSSGGGTASSQRLVSTGWPTWWVAAWALLLLAFGRMAVLFSRPVRVLPPEES
jgi:hypothetical protein